MEAQHPRWRWISATPVAITYSKANKHQPDAIGERNTAISCSTKENGQLALQGAQHLDHAGDSSGPKPAIGSSSNNMPRVAGKTSAFELAMFAVAERGLR